MYDIIIIGSGPAGLSAALYGKRAGYDVLVLEKNAMSGGQILNTDAVDNYLGLPGMNGFEMAMKFREHVENMGVVFEHKQVTGITDEKNYKRVTFTEGKTEKTYEARSVVIATGASHALLHVPGEEELTGRGVSYCATCDGAFFREKAVAVVGGGDVAAEDAVFLARLCEKVYLIHRRDSLRAAKSLQNQLFSCSNVEVVWNSVVEKICGKEQVEAVQVRHIKEDKVEEIAVDGVFIAVGLHPNTELFQNVTTCDENGYVIAKEDCVTKTPGIFAAGDVRTKQQRQIITAVADGANAVMSIEKYFNKVKQFS
ncbi:MAG: thioredoxin-disulfide reductase [Bacillus sp. (in: Bacteria)]|nr:thioredoxin-disulfide reductase [Bacillus sp. (in: firmicutes)]MCM1427316.1 thioredoxin-disulfide reductase [Eubacterium sp.]